MSWQARRPAPQGAQPGPRPAARQLRPIGRRRGAPERRRRGKVFGKLLKPLSKIAKVAPTAVPGVGPAAAAGLTVAEHVLRRRGTAGLGALYEAPAGTLYRVQSEKELHGLAQEDELEGLAAEDAGTAEEVGIGEEDLDGYVRDEQAANLSGYEPATPPQTPWHTPPSQPHRMWQPLW